MKCQMKHTDAYLPRNAALLCEKKKHQHGQHNETHNEKHRQHKSVSRVREAKRERERKKKKDEKVTVQLVYSGAFAAEKVLLLFSHSLDASLLFL